MRIVVAAARYLLATEETLDGLALPARQALEAGMVVCYARAFNDSRGSRPGEPGLPSAPTRDLPDPEIHEWAITERNTVYAHVERGTHRQVAHIPMGTYVAVGEKWMPPGAEQLDRLARHAETLRLRYCEQANDLARELGEPTRDCR